jgi:hypothetical protein
MNARFHVKLDQLKEEEAAAGKPVTSRALAAAAMISPTTACKVILDDGAGRISQRKDRVKPGMGSSALSVQDEIFLLVLWRSEPGLSLNRYVKALFDERGTKVSRSTISRWFDSFTDSLSRGRRSRPTRSH